MPAIIVKLENGITSEQGTKEDIIRDFRRIYLRMALCAHGNLWTLKEIPCADTLTLLSSISVKRTKNGELLIGLVSSFNRHFDKFWTKQTVVSNEFIKQAKHQNKSKNKKPKKQSSAKSKKQNEMITLEEFFELKLANVFGRAIYEFKTRVGKLPVYIYVFINEENCYYGALYDKVFRSVTKRLMCHSSLIVIRNEEANLLKNKMFFSFCNSEKDISGE